MGVLRGGRVYAAEGSVFGALRETGASYAPEEVLLLPPCAPGKVICLGLNYYDHIREQSLQVPKEPYIIHRPASSVIAHGRDILIRYPDHPIQFEGELALVIGRVCRGVSPKEAMNFAGGVTVANDVTDKFYFKRDGHFGVAKSFDGTCPLGPAIETEFSCEDLSIVTRVNGQVRQRGSTADMVFSCAKIISYLSNIMTLYPEDVILTGSPAGVGMIGPGDEVEIEIQGVGTLLNRAVLTNYEQAGEIVK